MTPDPLDPKDPSHTPPRGNPESVIGSDSALGLAPPPPEELSSGSSIFDHHVPAIPPNFSGGATSMMKGECEFVAPDAVPASDDPDELPADEPAAAAPEESDLAEGPTLAGDAAEPEGEHDVSSPSHDVSSPSHDVSSPSHDVFSPSHDVFSPSHDVFSPSEEALDEAAPAESGWTEFLPEDLASTSDEEVPDGDDADAMELTTPGEGEGGTDDAQDAAVAEDWSAEPPFEPAPAAENDPAAPSISADDDQDALAGLGALAGGVVAGAALAEDSLWTSDTTSETADSSSSYRPPAPPAPPKRDFVKLLLISYAVLVTVAAGLLWKRLAERTVNEQRLESLPDVRMLKVGQVSTFDPIKTPLPPGHLLKLGEKRRFGNIEVEATKITRGMVTYEHPAGDRWTLLPEGPVVKLWLRFRNVSKDQPIPPLDKYLVFSKTKVAGSEAYQTNNVLTTATSRTPVGYVLTHDHADKNILKGQKLDVEIPPGGTLETYIPSTPDLDLPTGELLWRVHLRKGFGKAGAGVTTLIDIAFSANDVVDDGQG